MPGGAEDKGHQKPLPLSMDRCKNCWTQSPFHDSMLCPLVSCHVGLSLDKAVLSPNTACFIAAYQQDGRHHLRDACSAFVMSMSVRRGLFEMMPIL